MCTVSNTVSYNYSKRQWFRLCFTWFTLIDVICLLYILAPCCKTSYIVGAAVILMIRWQDDNWFELIMYEANHKQIIWLNGLVTHLKRGRGEWDLSNGVGTAQTIVCINNFCYYKACSKGQNSMSRFVMILQCSVAWHISFERPTPSSDRAVRLLTTVATRYLATFGRSI